jgi:hypothetical protein
MQPITPTRFYELLEKSEHDYIELWNSQEGKYIAYQYIKKITYSSTPAQIRVKENNCGYSEAISHLYETRPRTAYDDLKDCLYDQHIKLTRFSNLYQSELESIPSKMD